MSTPTQIKVVEKGMKLCAGMYSKTCLNWYLLFNSMSVHDNQNRTPGAIMI